MKNGIAQQVAQACGACGSKYCIGCKITVRKGCKRVVVNGITRRVERVERMPVSVGV